MHYLLQRDFLGDILHLSGSQTSDEVGCAILAHQVMTSETIWCIYTSQAGPFVTGREGLLSVLADFGVALTEVDTIYFLLYPSPHPSFVSNTDSENKVSKKIFTVRCLI